ncbi:MAG: hypothetical protein CMJ18_11660 [Phycisphaeraceae bacterium]|nr:hypothetical protein [Phycisphaeraceae bacterium]
MSRIAPGTHGNPALALPAGDSGGRLVIERPDGDVVWRGHEIAAGVGATTVDAWHGRFTGACDRYAMLPAGTYQRRWQPAGASGNDGTALEKLTVSDEIVVDADLTRVDGTWLGDTRHRQAHGAWRCGPDGLQPGNETAYLFFDAAMHGTWRATFVTGFKGGTSFGLISRHYNATTHIRVSCTWSAGRLHARLLRFTGGPPGDDEPHTVAEANLKASNEFDLTWTFNGSRHLVELDETPIIDDLEGFMGGVGVVGMYCEPGPIECLALRMTTTQHVPSFDIDRPSYRASIRPGNISRLELRRSARPEQNLFWESGVQYGHIGGSEIKFTQGARQHRVADGPVASVVRWQGPMPKFVEQSDDVRGWARGEAQFYPEHIVVSDKVLTWVRRSVGPDFDLLGRLMPGPARVAMADEREFREWTLPADGAMASIQTPADAPTFPVAAAFPFKLDGETWWLTSVIALNYPTNPQPSAALFAWQDPLGLTGSHDFRCAPSVPGWEYAYTLLISWRKEDAFEPVGMHLLEWRDAWSTPARLEAVRGSVVTHDPRHEAPREAMEMLDGFDRATGRYVVIAEDGAVHLRLDPLNLPRRDLAFTIRDWPSGCPPHCIIDGNALRAPNDFVFQFEEPGECWLLLRRTVECAVKLEITQAS